MVHQRLLASHERFSVMELVTLLSCENRRWMKRAEDNMNSWACLSDIETWISVTIILVTQMWKSIVIEL
jgi:hypothetical protein